MAEDVSGDLKRDKTLYVMRQRPIPVKGNLETMDVAGRPFPLPVGEESSRLEKLRLWVRTHRSKPDINRDVFVTKTESDQNLPLAVITRSHGRAVSDPEVNSNIIYGDTTYSNIVYGGRDWKGGRIDNPEVQEDDSSPYGLRVNGLKDDVGVGLVDTNSKILRANGLPTERIAKRIELKEIIYKGKKMGIEEWKRQYVAELRARPLQDQLVNPDRVEKYLNETKFYIFERDLQLAERLSDIRQPETKVEFESKIKKVFDWINTVATTKKFGVIPNTPVPKRFEMTLDDQRRYFLEWIPQQMGIYLARLHMLGLIHGYPHEQNWSLAGTLYDLDSVHKEVDDRNRESGQRTDVEKAVLVLKDLCTGSKLLPIYLNEILKEEDGISAVRNLSKSYLQERGLLAYNTADEYRAMYKRYIQSNVTDEELDALWGKPQGVQLSA